MRTDRDHVAPTGVWTPWPVSWSPVILGALVSVVAAVLFGLVGTGIGAHKAGLEGRITTWSGVGFASLAFAVFSSFFAFVIGAWTAARLGGIRRSEPAMVHGAITWVIGVFLLFVLAALGSGFFYGWFAGLAPAPLVPSVPGQPIDPGAAIAARNGALAAAMALIIGLIGAVVGGWMASGEPMMLGRYRVRLESHPEVSETRMSDRTTRIS
jgi:uncharacterized membrane protein